MEFAPPCPRAPLRDLCARIPVLLDPVPPSPSWFGPREPASQFDPINPFGPTP